MLDTLLDYLRIGLYILLAFVCFTLYQAWKIDYPEKPPALPSPSHAVLPQGEAASGFIPSTPETSKAAALLEASKAPPETFSIPSNRIIHVTTDVLDVEIDALGGDLIQVKLLQYPESLHTPNPYLLLNHGAKTEYLAQSGLLSEAGPDHAQGKALYKPEKLQYKLETGQDQIVVRLFWQNSAGLAVVKSLTFHRNNYEIDLAYQISNQANQAWKGNLYNQLLRTDTPPPNGQGLSNLTTFFGAAISSPEKTFQKISFKDMQKNNLNQAITGGWAAMIQHYFVTAWIPDKTTLSDYYSKVTPGGLYAIGMVTSPITVLPHQETKVEAKLYSGPALTDRLEKAAPGLQLTIDYGIFWFISVAIFWLMQKIYEFIGNWGWSIVITTLIIKLLFYQLSAKSYRSMSMLKKLQPRMERLKELYSNDRQKLTQATMDLYRQEKVNPMGGCLPILIQIPVFIALYWVLVESVQLRHAPFILWIHDLTAKDPYYIFPVLVGLSMFLQQRLSPPPPDPMQAKVMMFMPVIFTALFMNFPAGLMLYWFVNNTLSFFQQWYIMRTVK
ncbi:MAG TPA: membrane protein insertase YidC [Gammaproteobacteria bacterium]|nr:membrane protein insertase YidC [Gammaproteobacteria bacterium]